MSIVDVIVVVVGGEVGIVIYAISGVLGVVGSVRGGSILVVYGVVDIVLGV